MNKELLYCIPAGQYGKEGVLSLLAQHPEIRFVSLIGVDLAGNDTDEKIPIEIFIKDYDDFFAGKAVQTDGSSVVFMNIATLNDARVDFVADNTVNWYVDYNDENIDMATGLPVGTLRIPSFLTHKGVFIDSRSILKQSCEYVAERLKELLAGKQIKGMENFPFEEIQDIIFTTGTELEFWVKTPSEKEIMQNAIDFLTENHKALNICELSKERIRRAGDTIEAECNQRKSKDLPDIGFRVFRIADSNMKDVYYSAKEYSQSDLFYFTDNIKEDRTGLDLLYGCLTNLGLSLSLPHDEEDINGYTVYSVDKTELMACFAEQIPEKVFREIAGRQPRRVVFRDASFRDSADRINIDEIFKTLSPGTTIEIL